MRANIAQTNFTAGEISPLMYGRSDVNKYANGAKTINNFIVRPQGGVCRRPGSLLVNRTKLSTYTRLIPFVISSSLSYVIEFGQNYLRFYNNGSVVLISGSPFEVVTPWLATDLDQLYFAQSADVMFITHPKYQTQVLSRISNNDWTLVPYVAEDGPYLDIDTTGNVATLTQVADVTTIIQNFLGTGNTTTIIAAASTFVSGSVGSYVLNPATTVTQPLLLITHFTDTTHVTGQFIDSGLIIPMSSFSVTFAAGTLTAAQALFSVIQVGSFVQSTLGSWYKITAFIDSQHVSATALTILGGSTTITFSGGGVFTAASVGNFLEYLIGNTYYYSKVVSFSGPTQVGISILQHVVALDTTQTTIAFIPSSTTAYITATVLSSNSGIFSPSDVGSYVRSDNGFGWGQIYAYTSSSQVAVIIQPSTGLLIPVPPGRTFTLQDNRSVTLTAQFQDGIFDVTDVGRLIRFQLKDETWVSMTVSVVVNPALVKGFLSVALSAPGPTIAFRLGAWSNLTGYPAIVCLHQQRLVFGNSTAQPSTIWMSQPSDYFNQAPTEPDGSVIASDAISLTLANGTVDPITWMRSGQVLLLGTFNSEYEITAPAPGGISPTNISATTESAFGSLTPTIAYRFGVATLFLQRGGNKLREMVYQFQYDSFNSKDISVPSEHIFRVRGGAKSMAYQVEPVSAFWVICNNGDLVSVTYDRDQEIAAFTSNTIQGLIAESVVVIPNGGRDDVYVSGQRSVGGGMVRTIELMQPMFDSTTGSTLLTTNFLDYATYYSGTSTNAITDFNYAGLTVWAIINGVVYPNIPVLISNGIINLPVSATNVQYGLNYSSQLATLSPDGASPTGTSQGKRKTIREITARLTDAMPFKHGPDLSHLTLIDAANFGADLIPIASQNQLVSGDVRFSPDFAWDQQACYWLVQDQPYPLTIDALMPTLIANE